MNYKLVLCAVGDGPVQVLIQPCNNQKTCQAVSNSQIYPCP